MIKAEFLFEENTDKILRVRVSGHAGFDSYGNDVICASVSALIIASVNALEEYVGINTSVTVENGATEFEIITQEELKSIQAQAIVHCLYIALTGMEDEYDDYIQVTMMEDNND